MFEKNEAWEAAKLSKIESIVGTGYDVSLETLVQITIINCKSELISVLLGD
jgi:hypothetical protein